jgi:hypothetical protein
MDSQQNNRALRSHLLKMSRLSQRVVDYSIKAYEMGRPEFGRHVRNTEHELRKLQVCIAYICRAMLGAGRSSSFSNIPAKTLS